MMREILKMGDPRLLKIAAPVEQFDTPELHELISDMFEIMREAKGVGLAAPQIGVDLQLVIFGFGHSKRYPDAAPVPETILLNPVITPLSPDTEDGWEGFVGAGFAWHGQPLFENSLPGDGPIRCAHRAHCRRFPCARGPA